MTPVLKIVNKHIFKILTQQEYNGFISTKSYSGNKLDDKDGFIHTSFTTEQVDRVIKKYYAEEILIVIVKLSTDIVKNLKIEPIKTGELYPHVYGKLSIASILSVIVDYRNVVKFSQIGCNARKYIDLENMNEYLEIDETNCKIEKITKTEKWNDDELITTSSKTYIVPGGLTVHNIYKQIVE